MAVVPTSNDIERFLSQTPRFISSREVRGVPSYTCIVHGLRYVRQQITWYHGDAFKLNSKDYLRIGSVLKTLLDTGALTRDPKRERQWVTANLVSDMTVAAFDDALRNGCFNWDMVIHRVFSLVFISAMGCRAGDVLRSGMYKEEYMKLGDIDLILKRSNQVDGDDVVFVERWTAMVTVRFEKGYKCVR